MTRAYDTSIKFKIVSDTERNRSHIGRSSSEEWDKIAALIKEDKTILLSQIKTRERIMSALNRRGLKSQFTVNDKKNGNYVVFLNANKKRA